MASAAPKMAGNDIFGVEVAPVVIRLCDMFLQPIASKVVEEDDKDEGGRR
jgi:hypothetical protein